MGLARKFPGLVVFLLLLSMASPVSARQVVVGLYDNPPKISRSPEGQPRGIFIDILQTVAERENWKLKFRFGTWKENLAWLKNGKTDLLPDVAWSTEREKQFDFNQLPVLSSWLQLYVHSDNSLANLKALAGKKIAVLAGSIQQRVLEDFRGRATLSFDILPLPDYDATIRAVEDGQAQGVLLGRFYGFSPKRSGKLVPAPVILNPSTLRYAAGKGRSVSLLRTLDRHLAILLNDGTSVYYQALARWLHSPEPTTRWPPWLSAALFIGGGALVLMLLGIMLLRWQIRLRTRQLMASNEQLLKSDRERQALTRELFHRTRNNMQILISMLSLQQQTVSSRPYKKTLETIMDKIRTMALVHQKLYQNQDLSNLPLAGFLEELVVLVCRGRQLDMRDLEVDILPPDLEVAVDIALPLGLVLYELITNSLEHAYGPAETPRVQIGIRQSYDRIFVQVRDHGRGLSHPVDTLVYQQGKYGLQTVASIIEVQLAGKLRFENSDGLMVSFDFPADRYPARLK